MKRPCGLFRQWRGSLPVDANTGGYHSRVVHFPAFAAAHRCAELPRAIFVLENEGQALRGAWGPEGAAQPAGDWNAARASEFGFRGEPSFWRVEGKEAQAGQISGAADLYLDGDRLEGEMAILCSGRS